MAKTKGFSMIDKSTKNLSMKALVRMHDAEEIRFDLAIQRNDVWDETRRSLFIHTILMGFPFPPVYAQDNGDKILWMLDGKQRMSTVVKYFKGAFALTSDTPTLKAYVDNDYTLSDEEKNAGCFLSKRDEKNVLETPVAGKHFANLTEDMQDKIKDTDFLVYMLRGLTTELRDEMFLRLNNGMALTRMELTRVVASSDVMNFIKNVSGRHFFKSVVNITDKARNRFVDDETILQILHLISEGGAVDISGGKLQEFARSLKANGIPDNIRDQIYNTTDYLGEAFVKKESSLKKLHVPMVFLMAVKAMEMNIPAVEFGGWVQSFFLRLTKPVHRTCKDDTENVSQYEAGTIGGTAKKDHVAKRIKFMTRDFMAHIYDGVSYVAPVEKVPSSPVPNDGTAPRRRGRPRKDSVLVVVPAQNSEKQDMQAGDTQSGDVSNDSNPEVDSNPPVDYVPSIEEGDNMDGAAD